MTVMNAATKEAVARANRRSKSSQSSRDSARSSGAGDDSDDHDSGGGGRRKMDSVKEVALQAMREARRAPPDEAVEDTAPAPAPSSAD